jgi:tetratricopeptide (TPR) repeat protein
MPVRTNTIYVLCLILIALGAVHGFKFATTYTNLISFQSPDFGVMKDVGTVAWIILTGGVLYLSATAAAVVGILRRKPWGLRWAVAVAVITIVITFTWLLLSGTYGQELSHLVVFGLCLLVLWVSRNKLVRKTLRVPTRWQISEKLLLSAGIVVMLLLTGGYTAAITVVEKTGADLVYFQDTVYEQENENDLSAEDLTRREILSCSLNLPDDLSILMVTGNVSAAEPAFVRLANPDLTTVLTISESTIFESAPELTPYRLLGFSDAFEFQQKMYREKVGLIYRAMQNYLLPIVYGESTVYQFAVGGLRGFICEKHPATVKSYYEYSIYDEAGRSVGINFILKSEEGFSDDLREHIIASLQLRDGSGQSGQEFLDEGLGYLSEGDIETAKFCFANALAQDPGSTQGYYYLALASAKTERWLACRNALNAALDLDPGNVEALDLLESVQPHLSDLDKPTQPLLLLGRL